MAFTPTNNLVSDPNVLLRNQQHAANVFNVDQFRLAPKSKFLFHVSFGINAAAVRNLDIIQRHGEEINMLVKSIDLPSFQIQSEILNQYNRKKAVQYQHKPNELNVTFHDDNMGLINQLWQNYYSYYYADPNSAAGANNYDRNAMRSFDFTNAPYGLDNNSTVPFFKYIKIYQMARHEFVCYELKNPLITSWNHNKLDYAQNAVHDFSMKLMYEAVAYSVGLVDVDNPEGFGTTHYDNVPSPLTGGPAAATANPSFATTNDLSGSAASILNSVITQINTAQNTKQPGSASTVSKINSTTQTLNGLQGFSFPT